MKQIELNIGLVNNYVEHEKLLQNIIDHPLCDTFVEARITEGEWKGENQPTLYVRLTTNYKRVSTIIVWVEDLCTFTDQTAIGAKINGLGYLV